MKPNNKKYTNSINDIKSIIDKLIEKIECNEN